jgi:fatty-acyl-CoA synthase
VRRHGDSFSSDEESWLRDGLTVFTHDFGDPEVRADMSDWFPKLTYGDLVNRAAAKHGDREFMCFEGRRWSFNETREAVDRATKGFMALGVKPGDKVSLWLPNRPEWVHIQFALAKVGAVLVPINTQFRTNDLGYVVRQSDSSTLVSADFSGPVSYVGMIQELCPELESSSKADLSLAAFPELRRVVVLGDAEYPGTYSWEEVLRLGDSVSQEDLQQRESSVDPDATATIMYTSGTTGFPKGVMHGHRIIRNIMDEASRIGVKQTDVILMYLPLFHAFGIYEGPLMAFVTGARMVLTARFEPGEALTLIEQEKCTITHGFDTHFHDMLNHPDFSERDLSSLRTGLLAAGLDSSEPTARKAHRLMGRFVSAWGMTEVGAGGCLGYPDDPEDFNACASGYPLVGYEFKIVDPETGRELPPNTPGEIYCKTYLMMQGYYKKPEETAKTIDNEGWLHSGDMGLIRDDGYLRFMGRYKEMLKVGGENVDPVEVEAHLLSHPAVNQAKVIGVPDDRLNEVAAACIIPNAGTQVSEQELLEHCKTIASFKRPHYILFVDEYPMTASGKVQKFNLSKIAAGRLKLPQ